PTVAGGGVGAQWGQMTQKARWRTAHIVATIIGAIFLALTARHILVINSPDLRTGALATSSMAATMVGLILLARFLARRQQVTLCLTLGFLGSGLLLGVHTVFSSALIRDTGGWTTQLADARESLGDAVISTSFLLSWAAWRWREALDRRVATIARNAIVVAVGGLLVWLTFALAPQPAFAKIADLVWATLFATSLIGIAHKNVKHAD